ncbi:MAG: NCS2 family permease [Candidatus Eisenbacteria bacterium]|nr:NCS2 family permease [Candidatus Eisenbacteria bacterium]
MLERLFRLREHGTTVRVELIAGVTTFMTMAYIVFVNPAILSAPQGAGMDFRAVMAATCVASAAATLLMGLLANYPIALAPGMGLNAFFSFVICGQMGVPWEVALGMVLVEGLVFIALSAFRVREQIVNAVPASLKLAAAGGIGLFIAFIGLKDAGIVTADPATLVGLGDLHEPHTLLALFGLGLTAVLLAAGVRGGILWGILATGAVGLATGLVRSGGVFAAPDMSATFLKMRPLDALRLEYVVPIFVLFFFDLFDTVGTLVGIGTAGGFMKDDRLPRAGRALMADAVGTALGAACGTSTTTSYIESAAGVGVGGRTGLSNVFTALLFLAALFFAPLAQAFGGGSQTAAGLVLHPVTAPALIVVGCLMMQSVARIPWGDYSEAIPAFLTLVVMPLTNISHGLAVGFVSYPLVKLLSGKGRQVHWLVYCLAVLFVLRYTLI